MAKAALGLQLAIADCGYTCFFMTIFLTFAVYISQFLQIRMPSVDRAVKLKDLKLENFLDFKANALRSGCMRAEENAESVAIF